MIRTQISVDKDLYERAKVAARRAGISLAELVRRSLQAHIATQPSDKPWMSYAGALEGDVGDSETVDDVVYGRHSP